jgi:hypothetical protein
MTTYHVIRKTDGAAVYTYASDNPVEWSGMEFATHDHLADSTAVAAPVVEGARRITRLAFRNRFTTAEKVALEIASLDNPNASMAARANAAALRANQADIAAATFIDLNRKDTRDGVILLGAVGLLGNGRALTILDTAITSEEQYNGN